MLIEVMPLPLNDIFPIVLSTEFASNVTEVRARQSLNELNAIVSTDAGKLIEVRPLPLNAYDPMVLSVELASNVTDVRTLQPINA